MSHDLASAAADAQARSRRSKQKKLGGSEVGVCRRKAGYRFHGIKPSNPRAGGMAAMLGTWIHTGALSVLRDAYGAYIELRVENDDLKSSIDAYYPEDQVVEDIKTKSANAFTMVRARGPARKELYQVHVYAMLLRAGAVRHKELTGFQPVTHVRVRYICRDNGEEFIHEQPFSEEIASEAQAWLAEVLASKTVEELPRDQDGPDLSYECDWCPFLDLCWGPERADGFPRQTLLVRDDADAEAAALEYDRARAEEREAKARKDFAKATLEATPDGIYGGFEVKHSESNPKPKPDFELMEQQFMEAGLEVPLRYPKPSRSISVVRAKNSGS